MATIAQNIAAPERRETAPGWFWTFLKSELAPYPGRGWTVARMTLAATIVMLLIMVYRLPNAALGAYYTLLLSRESPRATLRNAISVLGSVGVALCFVLSTAMMLAGSPILHFGWVALTLFVTFFLIDALSEYRLGTAFGFLAVNSITGWDFPGNPSVLVANTLWTALAVSIGAVVTVVIEYVSSRIRPQNQVDEGILNRLRVVELALRGLATKGSHTEEVSEKLAQYAMVGTALLRRWVLHSDMNMLRKQQVSAVIALSGRLVDLAANTKAVPADDKERERYLRAAENIEIVRGLVHSRSFSGMERRIAEPEPSLGHTYISDIEMAIAEIPKIIAGTEHRPEYLPSAADIDIQPRLFKEDAFSSGEALRFALRGTLAALVCYVIYNAVEWHGLLTSLATCMITALTNVGSSRQKQFLRVAGAIFGGVFIGMAAQVILLPYMDGIASFTLLFCAVTILSGWIATASPRLSYAGVQTAFAFYITHLRVFKPQTSLAVARDDVVGILLGLMSMWLIFDTIWAKDAATEMAELFVKNLRRVAAFHRRVPAGSRADTINKARVERAAINSNFDQIRNLADSVVFEFGAERNWKMGLRRIVRVLQPELRAFFLLQVSLLHHRLDLQSEQITARCRRNEERAENLLSLLADQAQQAWLFMSADGKREPLVERHRAIVSLIERYETELKQAEFRPGNDEGSHAVLLSRWILEAALAFGRSMMSIEDEGLLARHASPNNRRLRPL